MSNCPLKSEDKKFLAEGIVGGLAGYAATAANGAAMSAAASSAASTAALNSSLASLASLAHATPIVFAAPAAPVLIPVALVAVGAGWLCYKLLDAVCKN